MMNAAGIPGVRAPARCFEDAALHALPHLYDHAIKIWVIGRPNQEKPV